MKSKLRCFLVALILPFAMGNTFAQLNFADRVLDVSREYDVYPNAWSASQILGGPDVYPDYGDIEGAYSPESYGDQRDTIVLWFENDGPINNIRIYQTYEPGLVDSVWVKNPGTGEWDLVYGVVAARTGSGVAEILNISFATTSYNVSEVKIGMATDLATTYLEIDAVAISPGTTTTVTETFKKGNTVTFDGVDDFYGTLDNSSQLYTDSSKTITAWVRVDGAAPMIEDIYDGAGVVCAGDDGYFGIYHANLGAGDRIYCYNYSGDEQAVAVTYTEGEWFHIALVHDMDTIYAYKNGVLVDQVFSEKTDIVSGMLVMGFGPYNEEYFEGAVSSVATYNIGLSQEQIRETMHVIPQSSVVGLTAYYEFDEEDDYYTVGHDTLLGGNPIITSSELPVGMGDAASDIESAGTVSFTNTAFAVNYTDQGAEKVTVSKIDSEPNEVPAGTVVAGSYWVLNQFGNTPFTADYNFTVPTAQTDCQYSLYTREFNSTDTWSLVGTATSVASNLLSFANNINVRGQLVIMQEGTCISSVESYAHGSADVMIYPNPSQGLVNISVPGETTYRISLTNSIGQTVYSSLGEQGTIQLELPQGFYTATVETDNAAITKKIIVQ